MPSKFPSKFQNIADAFKKTIATEYGPLLKGMGFEHLVSITCTDAAHCFVIYSERSIFLTFEKWIGRKSIRRLSNTECKHWRFERLGVAPVNQLSNFETLNEGINHLFSLNEILDYLGSGRLAINEWRDGVMSKFKTSPNAKPTPLPDVIDLTVTEFHVHNSRPSIAETMKQFGERHSEVLKFFQRKNLAGEIEKFEAWSAREFLEQYSDFFPDSGSQPSR